VVDLRLDTYTPKVRRVDVAPAEPRPVGKATSALEILLDGVESGRRRVGGGRGRSE
jgi:hypothetical protein